MSCQMTVVYQEPEKIMTMEETSGEPVEELTEEQRAEQERQERIAEISSQIMMLKYQLESTDYQVLKNYEYTLVGLDPEYDIFELHQARQGLRDQINQLQPRMSELLQQAPVVENLQEPIEENWPDPVMETEQDTSAD